MFRTVAVAVAVAVLALAFVPSSGFAQFGGMGGYRGPSPKWLAQEWSVTVERADGKTLRGSLTLVSIPIDCELGLYHVKVEKVKAIQFADPGEDQQQIVTPGGALVKGAVVTASGERFEGTLQVGTWTVRTELGEVTLDPYKLKSVTFVGKVNPAPEGRPTPASPNADTGTGVGALDRRMADVERKLDQLLKAIEELKAAKDPEVKRGT